MEDQSLFKNFPEELYEEIFKYLNLKDLKSCKEVCSEWYSYLKHSKALAESAICVWNGDQMSIEKYIRHIFQLRRCIYIIGGEFRLREFDQMQIFKFTTFAREGAFRKVTHLEIVKSEFGWSMLKSLINKFRNLTSLTLSDTFITDAWIMFARPGIFMIPRRIYLTWIHSSFQKIKILKIHSNELLALRKLRNTIKIIGGCCGQLEYLSLSMFESRNDRLEMHRDVQFISMFQTVVKIIQKNAKTLKEVSLEFSDKDDRTKFIKTDFGATVHYGKIFIVFLNQLAKYTNWENSGLLLKNLKLRFGLVSIDNQRVQQIFLPFLKTQTSLQQFSFGQLFLQTNLCLEKLSACVPSECRCLIEALDFTKKFVIPPEDNSDSEDFVSEDNSDPEEDFDSEYNYDSEDDSSNEPEVDNDQIINRQIMPNVQQNIFQPPLVQKVVLFPPLAIGQPIQEILKENQVHSQLILNTNNIHLNSLFEDYTCITNINFLTRYIQNLTKINIQQFGFSHNVVIIDTNIQNIIGSVRHLKELCLSSCNMNCVTDFGLTGVGRDACKRMLKTNNFELKDGDITGLAISNLKNLHSLKLSDVGDGVTDITAYHAFNGLDSLNSLNIFKPKMSHDGMKMLQQLFQCNQMIKIEKKTQILFLKSEKKFLQNLPQLNKMDLD